MANDSYWPRCKQSKKERWTYTVGLRYQPGLAKCQAQVWGWFAYVQIWHSHSGLDATGANPTCPQRVAQEPDVSVTVTRSTMKKTLLGCRRCRVSVGSPIARLDHRGLGERLQVRQGRLCGRRLDHAW
jgi:hypothetical protein